MAERKRTGRPPKPPEERLESWTLPLSAADLRLIGRAARLEGRGVRAWARAVLRARAAAVVIEAGATDDE